MAAKSYVVKALGVQPTLEDGALASLILRGGQVPSNATPDWITHALSLDLIEEGAATPGLVVTAGDGSDLPVDTTTPTSATRTSSYDGTSVPSKSGSKADWVDWARRVEGVAPESDEGKALGEMTRDELADTYADKTPAEA